jgi:hypothetical protein
MWRQVMSGSKMESPYPMVSVNTSGIIFNSAAVEEVGQTNGEVCVFTDTKNPQRIGFCFIKGHMTGAYTFKAIGKSRSRRIGIGRHLKESGVLEKVNTLKRRYFPLKRLDEVIPDFEGSEIFAVEIK